jgi:hypothetical protein
MSENEAMYHFGLPGNVVWASHIIMGIFFIYVGYLLIEGKKINKWVSISFIVIGVLAAIYHAHLWYLSVKEKKNK